MKKYKEQLDFAVDELGKTNGELLEDIVITEETIKTSQEKVKILKQKICEML